MHHQQLFRKSARYFARSDYARAAGFDADDLVQEAFCFLLRYQSGVKEDTPVALAVTLSQCAFRNALRRGWRASSANAAGKLNPQVYAPNAFRLLVLRDTASSLRELFPPGSIECRLLNAVIMPELFLAWSLRVFRDTRVSSSRLRAFACATSSEYTRAIANIRREFGRR